MMRLVVVCLAIAACAAQVMLPDRPFKLHGPPIKPPVPPRIYSIHVDASIMHGYARTIVEYQMYNLDPEPMDVEFAHSFPVNAYVTDFQIFYGNGMHKNSELRVRDEKSKDYANAIRGGLPSQNHKNSRHAKNFGHSNYFGASTYVQPLENVTFMLQYEELLQSKFGVYEYQLELRPQEIVESINVGVHMYDDRRIINVATPGIKKSKEEGNPFADIKRRNDNVVSVFYAPTKWQQRDFHSRGINGIIKVQFQTEALQYGDYKIGNGHFAYYFSPTFPDVLYKHMIVVMDTSDSMKNHKQQLSEALKSLMSTIKNGDKYTVIEFGSSIKVWNGERFADPNAELSNVDDFAVRVTEDADPIESVSSRISQATQSSGGNTNLNLALDAALSIAHAGIPSDAFPYIVLMSDGKVNVGERNFEKIIRSVRFISKEKVPIFTLAMGDKPEETFLSRLASDNYGYSMRIERNADVAEQLKEFQKLMDPIVGSITMDFGEIAVHNSISTYSFPSHFRGSEKVVTGKLIEARKDGQVVVYMNTIAPQAVEQIQAYEENALFRRESDWFLERIWAYNTIKDTIRKVASRASLIEIHAAQRKAADLSVKYNFASELTTMIVRTVGHAPDIQNEVPVHLNGVSWSDEGPEKERPDAPQFGFIGGLTLSFIPQITPFHELVENDLRKKFNWPITIGIDGTAILENGKALKLGFGRVKLPYGDPCVTGGGLPGMCRLVHFCHTYEYTTDYVMFVRNSCKYLDQNVYDGVCCPLDYVAKVSKQSREEVKGSSLDQSTTTTEGQSTTEKMTTAEEQSTTEKFATGKMTTTTEEQTTTEKTTTEPTTLDTDSSTSTTTEPTTLDTDSSTSTTTETATETQTEQARSWE